MGLPNIGGVGAPLPQQGAEASQPLGADKFESMQQAMADGAKVLDQETAMFSKEMIGQKKQPDTAAQQSGTLAKQAPSNEEMLQQASVLAGQVSAQDEEDTKLKKKKKKERTKGEAKLNGLMQQLSGLEDQVDPKQLDVESKGVFEKFFGIMRQIKNLRRELKQLSMEEDELEKQLNDQEKG